MNLRRLWNTWWKKVLWILIGLLIALLVSAGLWVKYVFMPHLLNPWLPPQMQFAQPVLRDVVGDLGGVPVTIPRDYISLVEYEGDPGWGKREGPVPKRDHRSRLTGFSIDFRWPDMAAASTPELKADKRNSTSGNTKWIFFGVGAGSSYPKMDNFLDRRADSIGEFSPFKYEKLPKPQHGLTVYTPVGVDPSTRVPFKKNFHDRDVFVHHAETGHVDAYIECSNVMIPSATCGHTFSLAPRMNVKVAIRYRRGLLPEWQAMQTQVTRLIESWVVDPTSVVPPPAR